MHHNAQLTFLVACALAFGALVWMRPDTATAAGGPVAIETTAVVPPDGMADRFYNEKASAAIEPLPAQF